jgi:hypothetical protein
VTLARFSKLLPKHKQAVENDVHILFHHWQQATKHWCPQATEELKKYAGRHHGSCRGVIPHRIINIYLTQEQLPF